MSHTGVLLTVISTYTCNSSNPFSPIWLMHGRSFYHKGARRCLSSSPSSLPLLALTIISSSSTTTFSLDLFFFIQCLSFHLTFLVTFICYKWSLLLLSLSNCLFWSFWSWVLLFICHWNVLLYNCLSLSWCLIIKLDLCTFQTRYTLF